MHGGIKVRGCLCNTDLCNGGGRGGGGRGDGSRGSGGRGQEDKSKDKSVSHPRVYTIFFIRNQAEHEI